MAKTKEQNFTEGPILGPMLKFAVPVLLALVLQAMYGAVDLLVVGKFASSADVSAVATGSQLTQMIANVMASLALGTTIILGQQIGQGYGKDGGKTIGASVLFFLVVGLIVTVGIVAGATGIAGILNAPEEAFDMTVSYIRICGAGSLVIIFYNLIGAIFRGIGDSTTPLITVAIACVVNIAGDLFFVAVLGLGTTGAALATVLAQGVSVIISLVLIMRKELSFEFHRDDIRWDGKIIRRIMTLGIPVATSEFLVGASFLVIAAIVNSLGVTASAGVGVAEKVCAFIMLVPSAFMQSLAAIVSQNYGAGKMDRAYKTLRIAIGLSILMGILMFYLSFFHGSVLAGIFSSDEAVILAAADYLKAYAIDCLFTAFLFCFVGFYNGIGKTRFVMMQGIIGAFGVRVPLSFLFSRMQPVSLFRIGLATPSSTIVQITMCLIFMLVITRKAKKS